MIHDQARVDAIRARVAAQIELIRSLEAKIVKGTFPALEVARKQTGDIASFFLEDVERQGRTAAEEARWLSYAEHMLQVWAPYLKDVEAQFGKYSSVRIEIVGEQ